MTMPYAEKPSVHDAAAIRQRAMDVVSRIAADGTWAELHAPETVVILGAAKLTGGSCWRSVRMALTRLAPPAVRNGPEWQALIDDIDAEAQRQQPLRVQEEMAALRAADPTLVLFEQRSPMEWAERFVAARYPIPHTALRGLVYAEGVFLAWLNEAQMYEVITPQAMVTALWLFLARAKIVTPNGAVDLAPRERDVKDTVGALTALCSEGDAPRPRWRPGTIFHADPPPAADEFLLFRNSMIHLSDQPVTLFPATPALLSTARIEANYDPNASCQNWLACIQHWFSGDAAMIATVQEMFGYVLSGSTRRHVIFLLLGAPRTGKSTLLRILAALMGEQRTCSPTLSHLASEFGLQQLLGKTLAIIGDAQGMGEHTSRLIAVERLKLISGEDPISVNRKLLTHVDGRLGVRFVIAANVPPALPDPSGAISERLIIMRTLCATIPEGERAGDLEQRLRGELDGIAAWAMLGLERLRKTNVFSRSPAVNELTQTVRHHGSPVQEFIEDECVVDAQASVSTNLLYRMYRGWCEANGHRPVASSTLGTQLHALIPGLTVSRPRVQGRRTCTYIGIGFGAVLGAPHSPAEPSPAPTSPLSPPRIA